VDIIVPLDYALTRDRSDLSPASYSTLRAAKAFAWGEPHALVVCASTDHPDKGMVATQGMTWREGELLPLRNAKYYTTATNSIDEAENVRDELVKRGVTVRRVHIFADRFHVARARAIWKQVLPRAEVIFHPVACRWGRDQAQFVQRNTFVWALANFAAYCVMQVVGMNSLRGIKQHS
jgi:hypothetical protein